MSVTRLSLVLFVAFAALYQLSFGTLPIPIPDYPTWIFYGDSRESILRSIETMSNIYSVAKHPLYPVLGRPLFALGLALYSGLEAPWDVNFAVTLPSALMGAAGVVIVYHTLRRNQPEGGRALPFALLYGLGTAPWMFASFPDTYAFTAFFTALYFAVLIRVDPEEPRQIFALSAANALACWSSPQQLLLAVIPGVYWLLKHGIGAHLIRRVVQYSAGLVATWVLPYYVWLLTFGPGWRMPHQYMKENVEFSLGFIGTVLLDFHVFSIVGPSTHPDTYTDPTFTALTQAPIWWWPLLAIYLFFVFTNLRTARTAASRGARYVPGIAVFMIGYSIFFMLFNAGESYLMAMTCAFPWIFALHSAGAVESRTRAGPLPWVLVALVAASNLSVLSTLRADAIANPLGHLPKEAPPEPEPEAGTTTATVSGTSTTAGTSTSAGLPGATGE